MFVFLHLNIIVVECMYVGTFFDSAIALMQIIDVGI